MPNIIPIMYYPPESEKPYNTEEGILELFADLRREYEGLREESVTTQSGEPVKDFRQFLQIACSRNGARVHISGLAFYAIHHGDWDVHDPVLEAVALYDLTKVRDIVSGWDLIKAKAPVTEGESRSARPLAELIEEASR